MARFVFAMQTLIDDQHRALRGTIGETNAEEVAGVIEARRAVEGERGKHAAADVGHRGCSVHERARVTQSLRLASSASGARPGREPHSSGAAKGLQADDGQRDQSEHAEQICRP